MTEPVVLSLCCDCAVTVTLLCHSLLSLSQIPVTGKRLGKEALEDRLRAALEREVVPRERALLLLPLSTV